MSDLMRSPVSVDEAISYIRSGMHVFATVLPPRVRHFSTRSYAALT